MEEERVLTQRARDVLFFAKYYSSPDKPRPVEPEHILLALVLIDPTLLQLLSATDSDEVLTGLKEDLRAYVPTTYQSWVATESPPLSPAAQEVISLAAEESKVLGEVSIGTQHLLLALIKSRPFESVREASQLPVHEILRRRGFTIQQVGGQLKGGSLTPQSNYSDQSEVLRPLPASLKPRTKSFYQFIKVILDRFRILFGIVLIMCWPNASLSLGLSKSNYGLLRERGMPVMYLALGDSTGLGLGAKGGYGYVERLMSLIQEERPRSHLVKLCRVGETTTGLRQRIAEGLLIKPTLITLSIGINDLLNGVSEEQFAANYEELVKTLRHLNVPIVVTNLPDVVTAPRLPKSMREDIRLKLPRFNKRIETAARDHQLVLVDLYRATATLSAKHPEFFAADGFHPSGSGYQFWARTMWPKVKAAINTN